MISLTVIVVTYNSARTITSCLDSCRELETIVVDNASSDSTVELVRQHSAVRLIANARNRGFAAAVNQAVEQCNTEFVLLLNPDVILLTEIDPLMAACTGKVGASAGQLVDQNGDPQAGFTIRRFPGPAALVLEVLGINRLLPWNPVNRSYRYKDRNLGVPGEVDQPAGAFLLFRKNIWESLGGFDEDFFPVWFEDVDFCRRMWQSGYSIVYVPAVKARHTGGESVRSLARSCRELYWYVSLLRYASKRYGALSFRLVSSSVAVGAAIRALIGIPRKKGFELAATYAKVIQIAVRCLVSGAAGFERLPFSPCLAEAGAGSGEVTPRAGNTTNRNELHVL